MSRTCTVDGCDNVHLAKGLCKLHYQRVWKSGSLESSFRYVGPLERYGHLTTIRRVPSKINKWLCKCDCRNESIVFASNLTTGHSASCGCAEYGRATTHGKSLTREYRAWINLKIRCELPTTPYYKDYGGRGISVCDRWQSFENFLSDMGPRPSPKHSVDRIDVNGNYEPGNCRWATNQTQGRNKRYNHLVMLNGREMTLADAVEEVGLPYNTVLYRLKRGWSVDDALGRPING